MFDVEPYQSHRDYHAGTTVSDVMARIEAMFERYARRHPVQRLEERHLRVEPGIADGNALKELREPTPVLLAQAYSWHRRKRVTLVAAARIYKLPVEALYQHSHRMRVIHRRKRERGRRP